MTANFAMLVFKKSAAKRYCEQNFKNIIKKRNNERLGGGGLGLRLGFV